MVPGTESCREAYALQPAVWIESCQKFRLKTSEILRNTELQPLNLGRVNSQLSVKKKVCAMHVGTNCGRDHLTVMHSAFACSQNVIAEWCHNDIM